MSIEAMKMALDALDSKHDMSKAEWRVLQYRAFNALRDAITEASMQRLTDVQQEMDCYGDGNVYRGQRSSDSQTQTIYVQEPVAWADMEQGAISLMKGEYGHTWKPLYTHPPRREWVGLTDEEIDSKAQQEGVTQFKAPCWFVELCRDIESNLKEKNGG